MKNEAEIEKLERKIRVLKRGVGILTAATVLAMGGFTMLVITQTLRRDFAADTIVRTLESNKIIRERSEQVARAITDALSRDDTASAERILDSTPADDLTWLRRYLLRCRIDEVKAKRR